MLRRIIDAHGGRLPDGIVVAFADTGKEHKETYKFLDAVESNWGVKINRVSAAHDYGETPFDTLIRKKNYLPNPSQRFCTQYLKVIPLSKLMAAYEDWTNVVGIRADEPMRVAKIRGRDCDDLNTVMPLAEAGVTKSEVMSFWVKSSFDLGIPPGQGNCVGCFLKGTKQLVAIEQSSPGSLAWWASKERQIGGRFRKDRPSYESLIEFARNQGTMNFGNEDKRVDCFCTEDEDG